MLPLDVEGLSWYAWLCKFSMSLRVVESLLHQFSSFAGFVFLLRTMASLVMVQAWEWQWVGDGIDEWAWVLVWRLGHVPQPRHPLALDDRRPTAPQRPPPR